MTIRKITAPGASKGSRLGNINTSALSAPVPTPASNNGPFMHADRTLAASIMLTTRVTELARRLVSHYGPPSDLTADAAEAPSVFGTLDDACSMADLSISRANEALDAIESALP